MLVASGCVVLALAGHDHMGGYKQHGNVHFITLEAMLEGEAAQTLGRRVHVGVATVCKLAASCVACSDLDCNSWTGNQAALRAVPKRLLSKPVLRASAPAAYRACVVGSGSAPEAPLRVRQSAGPGATLVAASYSLSMACVQTASASASLCAAAPEGSNAYGTLQLFPDHMLINGVGSVTSRRLQLAS